MKEGLSLNRRILVVILEQFVVRAAAITLLIVSPLSAVNSPLSQEVLDNEIL